MKEGRRRHSIVHDTIMLDSKRGISRETSKVRCSWVGRASDEFGVDVAVEFSIVCLSAFGEQELLDEILATAINLDAGEDEEDKVEEAVCWRHLLACVAAELLVVEI